MKITFLEEDDEKCFLERSKGIITLEVSRLSRSTQQLCEIIDIIREKHLRLFILGSINLP